MVPERSWTQRSIIDSLKKSEASNEQPILKSEHVENYQFFSCINLASDWGSKFFSGSDVEFVVVEANGKFHYSQNTYSVLGFSKLKTHLTQLMGWKVVEVKVSTFTILFYIKL